MQKIESHHEIGLAIKALKAIAAACADYFRQLLASIGKIVEVPMKEIAAILMQMAHKLQVFKPLVCHYMAFTQHFLPALIESKPAIKKLIEDHNNDGRVGHSQVTFSDMLIMPVQRITRYIGLAESLIKTYNNVDVPVELTESLTKLKSVADEMNDETRTVEYAKQITSIWKSILKYYSSFC